MHRRHFITGSGALALAAPSLTNTVLAAPAVRGDAALRGLLDAIFADDLIANPEDATGYGLDKGANAALRSQLDPRGDKARRANLKRNQRWLARLKAVDASSLSEAGRRQREVAEYMIASRVAAPSRFDIGSAQRPYPIFQQGGAYFSIPNFLESQHPVETAADAEAYLSRLSAFATALDQDTAEQKRAGQAWVPRAGLVARPDAGAAGQTARRPGGGQRDGPVAGPPCHRQGHRGRLAGPRLTDRQRQRVSGARPPDRATDCAAPDHPPRRRRGAAAGRRRNLCAGAGPGDHHDPSRPTRSTTSACVRSPRFRRSWSRCSRPRD